MLKSLIPRPVPARSEGRRARRARQGRQQTGAGPWRLFGDAQGCESKEREVSRLVALFLSASEQTSHVCVGEAASNLKETFTRRCRRQPLTCVVCQRGGRGRGRALRGAETERLGRSTSEEEGDTFHFSVCFRDSWRSGGEVSPTQSTAEPLFETGNVTLQLPYMFRASSITTASVLQCARRGNNTRHSLPVRCTSFRKWSLKAFSTKV